MKTFINILLLFSLSFAGCWNIYNDVADDKDDEYKFFLAATEGDEISLFSLDSDGTPNFPPYINTTTSTGNYYPAVHPSGNYLYVPDTNSTNVMAYRINIDGKLDLIDTENSGNAPYEAKIHPSGKYLYVSNSNAATISMYQINSDGTLTSLSPATVPTIAAAPAKMDIDPTGTYLFLINIVVVGVPPTISSISVFQISSTGLLTAVAGSPVSLPNNYTDAGNQIIPWNIIVHPNGKYLYISSCVDNGTTDQAIYIYQIQTSNNPPLIYLNYADIEVNSVSNPSIAMHPTGNYLYAKSGYSSPVFAYQINTDGTLTNIGSSTSIGTGWCELIVHPNGKALYVFDVAGSDRFYYNFILNENGTFNNSYSILNYSFFSTGCVLVRKKIK